MIILFGPEEVATLQMNDSDVGQSRLLQSIDHKLVVVFITPFQVVLTWMRGRPDLNANQLNNIDYQTFRFA